MSAPDLVLTDLLTAREVACWLAVSPRTVWRWTARGILPAPIRLTRRATRWRAGDIRCFLDNLPPRRAAGA
jgi:predicted DNA-binding transcriptional regulator AlpA